ncbi:hypothetical protein EV284_4615 [Streptomyces sp. BK022]|nr:hypothetical protein [Streptomyces sp. BK022]RZU35009.1 hypothetical protein EV284_4615 [Streptomyces sp. BK022]
MLAGSPVGELRQVVRDISLRTVPSDLLQDHCRALLADARRSGPRKVGTD